MSNCPNCGSSNIQTTKKWRVSWGRTVAKWTLVEPISGAGAITSNGRRANVCLDCRRSWRDSDLFKIILAAEHYTGTSLDFSREVHRQFIADFISEVGPFFELVSTIEKRGEKVVKRVRADMENASIWAGLGCVLGIVGCWLATVPVIGILILIGCSMLGLIVSTIMSLNEPKRVKEAEEAIRQEVEVLKLSIEDDLREKVHELVNRNPLQ